MKELAFQFLPPSKSEQPYTVSEINEGIALILESGNTLVWVEGEISNWRPSSNGHYYFRLKDQESQIPCVMWRSSAAQLEFKPEDGMAVMAIASIRIYQKGGYYQLDVHRMLPAGKGALYAAFEQLKEKLEKEGLFDESHKKPLPATVCTLGVVTSRHGAAVRDIIKVVSSRAPQTDILLVDVAVQGEKAAGEIAAAIRDLNEYGDVDCMIVGRGGGSIEDLWAFNEEVVARAIYESRIPVISAVGHEIDFTIADFVADVRAPTPSAAAEIAVADCRERRRFFDACAERFTTDITRCISGKFDRFGDIIRRRSLRHPLKLILEAQQHNDELKGECFDLLHRFFLDRTQKLAAGASRLQSLSPLAVLSRGYSVVTKQDGTTVKKVDQVVAGENVSIRFRKGSACADIVSVENGITALNSIDSLHAGN